MKEKEQFPYLNDYLSLNILTQTATERIPFTTDVQNQYCGGIQDYMLKTITSNWNSNNSWLFNFQLEKKILRLNPFAVLILIEQVTRNIVKGPRFPIIYINQLAKSPGISPLLILSMSPRPFVKWMNAILLVTLLSGHIGSATHWMSLQNQGVD